MTNAEIQQLQDPNVFSFEVHVALHNEGPGGPRLRQLKGVARHNAELDAIFETKVAEFRRNEREHRQPTAWNLPVRGLEWLSDHARFTPPREVFMTLVYVVLVLVGVDLVRQQVLPRFTASGQEEVLPTDWAAVAAPLPAPVGSVPSDISSRIDDWMLAELQQASQSEAWRAKLAEQLAAGVDQAALDDLLRQKLAAALDAPEFQAEVARHLQASLTAAVQSLDIEQQVAARVQEALRAQTQSWLQSAEFQQLAATAAQPAPAPAAAVAGDTPSAPVDVATAPAGANP